MYVLTKVWGTCRNCLKILTIILLEAKQRTTVIILTCQFLFWNSIQCKRADSQEKTLMLGKTEDRIRWLDYSIADSTDMSLSKFQEIVKDREACMLQSMVSQTVGHDLREWTPPPPQLNTYIFNKHFFHWTWFIFNKYFFKSIPDGRKVQVRLKVKFLHDNTWTTGCNELPKLTFK